MKSVIDVAREVKSVVNSCNMFARNVKVSLKTNIFDLGLGFFCNATLVRLCSKTILLIVFSWIFTAVGDFHFLFILTVICLCKNAGKRCRRSVFMDYSDATSCDATPSLEQPRAAQSNPKCHKLHDILSPGNEKCQNLHCILCPGSEKCNKFTLYPLPGKWKVW